MPVGKSQRRVSDLVVAREEVFDQTRVRSDRMALAVEISSSSESALRDHSIKAGEHAANGIAHYWVIDRQMNSPSASTTKAACQL
ncbi:Uma2 family endonuclease [Nocardia terrae]|uniref:Uma2 family endonuclease n=1 Tax=Nocardia terrae TaxID=2675851 RepID=UPI002E2538F8